MTTKAWQNMEVIPPIINEIIQMNSELPVRAIVESDNQI